MVNELKDIFATVNDLLKFAEAKNGAIVTLNGVVVFGIVQTNIETIALQIYTVMVVFLLLASIIISLLSFIPKLNSPYINLGTPTPEDNLIYFGDIAKYTPAQYYTKIKETLPTIDETLEMYYIHQIVINSKI
ncbi:MAG: hypothetical protein JXQ76_07310, partial [Campylobacterales bacterium]|nr:hypothetical protein [Campylobacterales bacterium]